MNSRNSEKVIDIVILRVLEFYLAIIRARAFYCKQKSKIPAGHSLEFRMCSGFETLSSGEGICCSMLSTG